MAEKDIQRYLDRIESQHKMKPRFMSHLTALLEMVDGAHRVAKDIPAAYDAHNAVGVQLDVVGKLVGVDRRFPPVAIPGLPSLLSDNAFRQVMLARIIQNHWDGTESTFQEIWDATMASQLKARYYDNQDMTISVEVIGQIEPVMVELILAGYIIPKPMGVGMNVNIIVEVRDESSRAGAVATLDDARLSCPMDYWPDRATDDVAQAGASMCANSGFAVCSMEYPTHSVASDSGRAGSVPTANSGYILCDLEYCRHSGIDEMGYSGTKGIANSARVTISTK